MRVVEALQNFIQKCDTVIYNQWNNSLSEKKKSHDRGAELSLKADEPQVVQRHEDVERKWEYYHIIIFPERTRENNINETLQPNPLPRFRTC